MVQTWVNLVPDAPIASNFTTTEGKGTPIVIQDNTGQAFYLSGSTIKPLNSSFLSLLNFGAKGDGVTDDSLAMLAALAYLRSVRLTGGSVLNYGNGASYGLYCPKGNYFFGSTKFQPDFAVHIFGDGQGVPGGAGTQFIWSAGTGGFKFLDGSNGWCIHNVTLVGGWVGGNEGNFHALEWDVPGTTRDLSIFNWEGDGFFQSNDTGLGTGNSNCSSIRNVLVVGCRRALACFGGDVNAEEITALTALSNRQCGIWEEGFLGNTHSVFTLEGNARLAWNTGAAGRPCSYVTQGGFQYACANGQEAWCSANAPSGTATSNTGWIYWQPGGVVVGIPAWFAGIEVRAGGGIIHVGASNSSRFNGYIEGDEFNQFDQKAFTDGELGAWFSALVVGGVIRAWQQAGFYVGPEGTLTARGRFSATSDFTANSATNFIGPSTGPVVDATTYFEFTNFRHDLIGRVIIAGVPTNVGSIVFRYGDGVYYDVFNVGWVAKHRNNSVDIFYTSAVGIELQAGKVLKVAGIKVIGAQGAAVANAAHSAAAPTKVEFDAFVDLFNTFKTRFEPGGHGLIA